ncbi:MAG: FMN-binding protein [Christensenellales bacterium]
MKKTISLILCILMLTMGTSLAELAFEPGVYTGVGDGMGGDVTVEVTFSENAIEEVTVVSHTETPSISDPAVEQIPASIAEAQSLDVDTVTGATITSKAILQAVENCAVQAGADLSLLKTEVELPENTYEGVGKGIGGELKVWLEVVDGEMVSLTVTEQSETEFVAGPALEKIPVAILEAQSFDVDVVTGATVTSRAIIEAAKDAAAKAGLDVEAMSPAEEE